MKKEKDRIELKLSDVFLRSERMPEDRQPCLEVRAVMLNINWGNNRELMNQCQRLREYSQCIATIREYESKIADREEAVTKAVDQCIAEGFLADILSKNKAEVIALFLTEYDEQAQRELDRAEAREEGLAEGREEGLAEGREQGAWIKLICLVRKKVIKGIPAMDAADMLEEPLELIRQIYDVVQSHPDWTEEEIYENSRTTMF